MRHKKDLVYIAISLGLVTLLMMFTEQVLPGHPFWQEKNLHRYYIEAAQNPFEYSVAPFNRRIFVPLLVNFSPISDEITFLLITLLSVIFSGLILGKILEFYGFGFRGVLTGLLLFYSIVFSVRYNLVEFWNPDAMLILFMLLGILMAIERKPIKFILVSIIGVLVKETYLIVLPLYFTLNYFNVFSSPEQKSDKPMTSRETNELLIQTLIISAIPVLIFFSLRYFISNVEGESIADIFYNTIKLRVDYFSGVKLSLNKPLFENQTWWFNSIINIYRITVGAFGGIIIIGMLNFRKSKNLYLSFFPLIVGAYLQLAVAVDNERLVVLAYLPFLISTVAYLKELYITKRVDLPMILLFTVSYFMVQIFLVKNVYHELYYSVFAQIILTLLFLIVVYLSEFFQRVKIR